MNVTRVDSKTKVSLTSKHFMTSGGQGDIYVKDGIVYKVYHDPKNVITQVKMDELKRLTPANIIRPLEHISSSKGLIGFTMNEIIGDPLVKVVTNTFWKANNIKIDQAVKLVNRIRDDTVFIHENDCLIIDGNEFNYLVDKKTHEVPYFIDVDSYQTKSSPATFIMPSIKDHHSSAFSELSDWFSFGIIACQLFIGIHPFKGNHPSYTKKQFEKRMIDNVSIFNKDVKLNSNVRDFNYIPQEYMDWFIDIFERGNRTPPPQADGGMLHIVPVKIKIATMTDVFKMKLIREYKGEIKGHRFHNGNDVIYIEDKTFVNARPYNTNKWISFTNTETPVLTGIDDHELAFELATSGSNQKLVHSIINADQLFTFDNSVFIKNDDIIMRIGFREIADKILPYVKSQWNVLPKSTTVYDGYVVTDALGKKIFGLPFESSKWRFCQIDELNEYKIINGKRRKNIIILTAFKSGQFDKFIIKFSSDYSDYKMRVIEDTDYHDANFDVLDTGVVVHIPEDNNIELFASSPKSNDVKLIHDSKITTTMTLTSRGQRAGLIIQDKLYELSM
jgi:hypothetical protein